MRKRILRGAAIVVLMLCVLAGVVIAATWKHWWWPVPSARVWIDGKPTSEVRVFRSGDRYFLHFTTPLQGVYMNDDAVPGYRSRVGRIVTASPFDSNRKDAEIWVLPWAAFSRTDGVVTSPLNQGGDNAKELQFKQQQQGFSFNNILYLGVEKRFRRCLYRVELP